MFMLKKRNLMDDFGGTQKYLVAKDIKNNMREIVYPEYHLAIPNLVKNILEMEQKEIERLSIRRLREKLQENGITPLLQKMRFN